MAMPVCGPQDRDKMPGEMLQTLKLHILRQREKLKQGRLSSCGHATHAQCCRARAGCRHGTPPTGAGDQEEAQRSLPRGDQRPTDEASSQSQGTE